jgi:hypothetical protein
MRDRHQAWPISIKVDGQPAELYDYLLNKANRPLPKEPTHYIVADVVCKDLSIKRVSIYFNPDDAWTNLENRCWEHDKPRSIGYLIGDNLRFIDNDPNTVLYTYWIVELASNKVLHKGLTYNLFDPAAL